MMDGITWDKFLANDTTIFEKYDEHTLNFEQLMRVFLFQFY